MNNHMGLCECGCGGKTRLAKQTDKSRNLKVGQPIRFIGGHQNRRSASSRWKGGRWIVDGYVYILAPSHPNATKAGVVPEHHLVAEHAIGHYLPEGAEVHHVNSDRANNKSDNLVICQDHIYHLLLHRRLRAFRSCGHASWRLCKYCKQYDDPLTLKITNHRCYHLPCRAKHANLRYYAKRIR